MSGSISELPCEVGGLTLLKRLGAGGMAEVFLASRPAGADRTATDSDYVVVKRMLPHLTRQSRYRALFRREAATGLQIDDPHVVRTLDLVESPQGMMLVTEYIDGLTLRSLARTAFRQKTPLRLPLVLKMMRDAASGLAGIHRTTDDRGLPFLHRDISPDNLIVDRVGWTRVLDFGIARPGGDLLLTRTGEIRGKLPFMPPEQIDARPMDGRSDLYSLGVTMFWMLTGRRPFAHASEIRLLQMICLEPAPSLLAFDPTLPPAVDRLMQALLAKDMKDRPRDAASVAAALDELGAASARDVAVVVDELMAPATAPHPRPKMERTATRTIAHAGEPTLAEHLPHAVDDAPSMTRPVAEAAAAAHDPVEDASHGSDNDEALLAGPTLDEASEWGSIADLRAQTLEGPPPRRPVLRAVVPVAVVACVVTLLTVVAIRQVAPPETGDIDTDATVDTDVEAMAAGQQPAAGTGEGAPQAPPTPLPPASSPAIAASKPVATRPTTTTAPARRTFEMIGAPRAVTWRHNGRVIGRGDGDISLPATAKTVEGSLPGITFTVPISGPSASWSDVPRGTLSVRGHEGHVLIGDERHEVPARITSPAGTWIVRHVSGSGTTTHKVQVKAGPLTSPTVLSLVAP